MRPFCGGGIGWLAIAALLLTPVSECAESIDPSEVISYLKKKIAYQLYHQPDYSCVMRFRQWQRERPMRLHKVIRNNAHDVFFLKGEEYVSRLRVRPPGLPPELSLPPEKEFSFGTPDRYLRRIFLSESTLHWFTGMLNERGRREARFHFIVPGDAASFAFRMGDQLVPTELQGEYRVDANTVNLSYLVAQFTGFAPEYNIKSASEVLEFGGADSATLHPLQPVRSELRFIQRNGFAIRSESLYSGCKEIEGAGQTAPEPVAALIAGPLPEAVTEDAQAVAALDSAANRIISSRILNSQVDPVLLLIARPAYPLSVAGGAGRDGSWSAISLEPAVTEQRR